MVIDRTKVMTPAPKKRRKNNFIDNKEFYAALVSHRKQCQQAEESGEPTPNIPRYIGKCFLDSAEHLSMRPNFSNYMFRQDMVMDAVENCVIYWHRFDPERSTNPSLTSLRFNMLPPSLKRSVRLRSGQDHLPPGFEELSRQMPGSADYNSIKDAADQRRRETSKDLLRKRDKCPLFCYPK